MPLSLSEAVALRAELRTLSAKSSPTDDELRRVDEIGELVAAEKKAADRQTLTDHLNSMGTPDGAPDGVVVQEARGAEVKSFGERFAASFAVGRARLKDVTISGGTLSLPVAAPGVLQGTEPNIAGLLSQQRVEGTDSVSFMKEAPVVNGAAVVAAGGLKPVTDLSISRVTVPVEVIAHVIEGVRNQDLADSQFLRELIDLRGRTGLLAELDDEVLNGDGTPGSHLTGILEDADLGTTAFDTDAITTIRRAIAELRLVQVQPDAVVIHPTDAAGIDVFRDEAQPLGGTWNPDRPWGLRRVESTLIAPGTALVGDFTRATLFLREDIAILPDPYNGVGGANMQRNLTDFRFEMRVAVGVGRGDAFTLADLSASS